MVARRIRIAGYGDALMYDTKEEAFASLRGIRFPEGRHFRVGIFVRSDQGNHLFDVSQDGYFNPYQYRKVGYVVIDKRLQQKQNKPWEFRIPLTKKKIKFI